MRRNGLETAAHIGGEAKSPRLQLSVLAASKAGRSAVVALVTALLAGMLGVASVDAASVSSASFTAGGVVLPNGTRYAKQGQLLTLTVVTDASECVEVTGAHTATQTSTNTKTNWTFPFTAGAGDGVQTVTAIAYRNINPQGKCVANGGEKLGTFNASYILDNSAPTLLPSDANKAGLSPAPNAAGWNRTNVAITWSAADGTGSGVTTGPTPATDSVIADTPAGGIVKTAAASDAVGNAGAGSVTIKLDKTAPIITPNASPAPNGFGWNRTDVTVGFVCSDVLSGIKSCTGGGTVTTNGANQPVSGTAIDNADNSKVAAAAVSIDKIPPSLSGAPTAAANALGWYNGSVTVGWTCGDQVGLSGIDGSCPAASPITGEGLGLTTTASVADKAGNSTQATSAPAVNIDKTAPVTSATAPANWNNVDVTVQLSAFDALSGVGATRYRLDGGVVESGTSAPISSEGVHTLEYWSVDNAGNEEVHKSVQIRIDKTPPTINHTLSPAPNANGWNYTDVTVRFTCADGTGSGIASCGPDQTIGTQGKDQPVTGTAVDNAGNSATDPAKVSIDKAKPTIVASRDRAANGSGWYRADVTVSFACDDALSGIDTCSNAVTLGEGANQTAAGTATDAAGNAAGIAESGINIDKTAPSLSGAATTAPNSNGWYRGNVIIDWTASDGLSGLVAHPVDDLLTGEGDKVCATKTVTDLAGNTATASVCVRIDRQAPATSASVPDPLPSGWYAAAVPVTLTSVDALSGVDKTYYAIDAGPAELYSGQFSFATKGVHTVTFWSVDKASNEEDRTAGGHTITLKIDGVPPTIVGSRLPLANGFGWNNTDVSVNFDCSDAESGIAGCVGATALTNEGADQSVTGTATDNAGNDASATVEGINIDKTPPTLAGSPTASANGAGWYRSDVTVAWSAQDGLSGIDTATIPANSVIAGEGRNLGAGPVSVLDKAGNAGGASISGIKIDRKGLVITPVKPAPNAAGWYSGDVVVGFNCADPTLADGTAGSGIAACPSDKLVSGNGANQSVTSDAGTDVAGNTTPGISVTGINIDGLAPQSLADNVCEAKNGWCRGATATVKVTASDQSGLSGVKEIRTALNGGPYTTTKGAVAEVVVPLNSTGRANVTYYAVDNADNAEMPNGIALKWDNIAPTVTHTLSPPPNADEWNNSDVTVHFDAADDDTGSGVDAATVTKDQVISTETSGTTVQGEAYDRAGNRGTDAVRVKLDKTPPGISAAITGGTLGNNGWYTSAVTVSFTCSDALSTVAVCPDPVTLTANGAGQSASGTARDYAGNQASTGISGINIDAEKPHITLHGIAAGGIYTLGAVPTASCTATDGFSGVASCAVSVNGGTVGGVGTFNFTATATDAAGNVATAVGTYRVTYDWGGFRQPINDTAHQIDQGVSVFKAASTVPAKFQLKKADGTVVQSASLPLWLTPAKGSPTTSPVDETVYADAATSGTTYRWDSTGQQYIYNWGTAKNQLGYYWRIGVQLDDGTRHYVNIGLR